jgi:hypothetical protein
VLLRMGRLHISAEVSPSSPPSAMNRIGLPLLVTFLSQTYYFMGVMH